MCKDFNKKDYSLEELAFKIVVNYFYKKSKLDSALYALNQGFIDQLKFDEIYNTFSLCDYQLTDSEIKDIIIMCQVVIPECEMDKNEYAIMFGKDVTDILFHC